QRGRRAVRHRDLRGLTHARAAHDASPHAGSAARPGATRPATPPRAGMPVAISAGMSIAPFPHRYIVELEAGKLASLPRQEILVGAPPQFGGTDTVWSPEELLVGAVITCLQTTFDA